jgi:hypothetical protein
MTQNTFLHKRKDLMIGFVNKSFYNELWNFSFCLCKTFMASINKMKMFFFIIWIFIFILKNLNFFKYYITNLKLYYVPRTLK